MTNYSVINDIKEKRYLGLQKLKVFPPGTVSRHTFIIEGSNREYCTHLTTNNDAILSMSITP